MKKILIVSAVVMLIILSNKSYEEIIIPQDSIRVRVIANSNSKEDQAIKRQVKNTVSAVTTDILKEAKTKDEADQILKDNLNLIDQEIKKTLSTTKTHYKINYGKNYFPQKKFKGVTYDEGVYDSLVVTLDSGRGDNWWCVLFPPLCLMEAEEENTSEVEYKSFIKEVIDKYF